MIILILASSLSYACNETNNNEYVMYDSYKSTRIVKAFHGTFAREQCEDYAHSYGSKYMYCMRMPNGTVERSK